jgi:predicted ATPase
MVKEGKVKSLDQQQPQSQAMETSAIPIENRYSVLQDNGKIDYNNIDQKGQQIYYNNLDQSRQQQLEGTVGSVPRGTVFYNQSALNR